MSGTRVTCIDIDNGDTKSAIITNDYIVVTDGNRYIASVQTHGNGTHVVTIKTAKAADDE